jgi:serine/threonine-protein kinase RsbW
VLPGGVIARVNQTFLMWTGHDRDDLVGCRRFQDLLTPGGRIFHETHFAPLLQLQGAVREIAVDLICGDGRRLPVLVNAVLDRDASGTELGARIVVFDATERRRYERELLAQRRAAERATAQVRLLQRLTAALAGAVEPGQILATVTDQLTEHLSLDGVVLALTDDDTGRLVAVGRHGSGEGVALPLVLEGVILGELRLHFRAEDGEREFLDAVAAQVAQAVERARLHTEMAESARRSARLAHLSRTLDEVRSLTERAQRLVAAVVPDLADIAVVELTDAPGLTRLAASSSSPASPANAGAPQSGAAGLVITPSEPVARALATGEPQRGPGSPSDPGVGTAHSYVVLPLRTHGRTMGALTLVATAAERRFRPRDLPFLSDLAYRAALALENVWVFEQERDVAQTLQQSMLAGSPPDDPRFTVTARYRPAVENLEVGGDWYDTFLVSDGVVGVVVGDVVGRGVEAASAMGQLRSAIRALAQTGLGPAAVLGHLDGFVEHVESARVATVVYAEIALDTGRMRYACAGHLPPLVVTADGATQYLWDGRSAPLGVTHGLPARAEAETVLPAGARLLLYTDGLVERRHRSILTGLERLGDELSSRRGEPLSALVDGLAEAMLADEDRRDDVCLLCLSYAGGT